MLSIVLVTSIICWKIQPTWSGYLKSHSQKKHLCLQRQMSLSRALGDYFFFLEQKLNKAGSMIRLQIFQERSASLHLAESFAPSQ